MRNKTDCEGIIKILFSTQSLRYNQRLTSVLQCQKALLASANYKNPFERRERASSDIESMCFKMKSSGITIVLILSFKYVWQN
jgi:hypothetical protein